MLIIFSGLPGTGKTSIARTLALQINAVFLRVDSIEHALGKSGLVDKVNEIGPAGYMAAYALAADNLRLGLTVVADSVNPLPITRDAWRTVATTSGVNFIEIEIICSNKTEHRQRVESREPDIPGFTLPTWEEVLGRDYKPWTRTHLILDTAMLSIEQSIEAIKRYQLIHNGT